MTYKYLTDPKRNSKLGGNPKKYLEKSISDIRNLRATRPIRSNPSAEEIQQYNNLIKDRQSMLNYITENPDYLNSSNA